MNIAQLRSELDHYPDDYITVISRNADGTYSIVAIEPLKYEEEMQARTITHVMLDRRAESIRGLPKRGEIGRKASVR
jgi:hypothetical protein